MNDNSFSIYNESKFKEPNIDTDSFIENENKITDFEDINILEFNKVCYDDNESEIDPRTIFQTKHKKLIFNIYKVKKSKKKGRKKFGENTSEGTHDKTTSDIIKQKIKRRFIKSIWKYLNALYKKYLIQNKRKAKKTWVFLKKIKTNFTLPLKRSKNLEYFSMTLSQFFSSDLSGKYTKTDKNYNKKNIDKLYQENKAKDIIKLMNKTLEEVYKIYISKKIPEFNLAHDLNEIQEKEKENEGNDYINRYNEKALNLIDIYKKRGKNDSLNSAEVNEILLDN